MNLTVRRYQDRDKQAVIALWEACGLLRPWNDPEKDIARKLTVQPELFLVAEDDGRLVGTVMAGFDGHRGWINYLAVSPGCRHQSCGTRLMQEAERLLLAMGCPKLNLQVRVDNVDANGFYRKLGYTEDKVISFGKRLIPD
ncbi:MAG: GNAT family acetyltransferase [Methylococcales bacterium]|nr:GNAT family acetyltransferase [Methylococcales bacterium]